MLNEPSPNQDQQSTTNASDYARVAAARELGVRRAKTDQWQPKDHWAEPLPLPPEVDFQADIQQDLKVLALLAAVQQVAADRGNSTAAQLDDWNYGRV